jgi:catechol 2,3-dioxygenase-like lactoylglutathione lyase family enzyme
MPVIDRESEIIHKLYLHHVSIFTPDVEASIAFYQKVLGMQLTTRFYQRSIFDIAFLQDGKSSNGLSLELIGLPLSGWREKFFRQRRPSLSHFSFVVDDVDAWYERFQAQEVEILIPPDDFLGIREMIFRDPAGLIVGIMAFLQPEATSLRVQEIIGNGGVTYYLHHLSITCEDINIVEHFYRGQLGLKTVIDRRPGGNIFMVDPAVAVDGSRCGPMIEVIDQTCWWDREAALFKKLGPCIDHISFLVDDVDTVYNELMSQGIESTTEPVDYGPNRIFFFRDPNGVEIEIQRPILPQLLTEWRQNKREKKKDRP